MTPHEQVIPTSSREFRLSSSIKHMKKRIGSTEVPNKLNSNRSSNFTPTNLENRVGTTPVAEVTPSYKRSLPAMKTIKNSLKPGVVSIDKKCFSCTNQNSVVLTAFKIA